MLGESQTSVSDTHPNIKSPIHKSQGKQKFITNPLKHSSLQHPSGQATSNKLPTVGTQKPKQDLISNFTSTGGPTRCDTSSYNGTASTKQPGVAISQIGH